jgi:hypothetical protein
MVNSAVANVGTRRPPIKPVRGAAQPPEPKVTPGAYSQNSSVAVVTSTNCESMALGVDPVRGELTKACQDRDVRPWASEGLPTSVEVVVALAEIHCRVR